MKGGFGLENKEKGLERIYGRGSGERKFRPIPVSKFRPRRKSQLYDTAHAAYPQTGAYATEEEEK